MRTLLPTKALALLLALAAGCPALVIPVLPAPAAAPTVSAPDRLARSAAGVMGSGDHLSLQLSDGAGASRTLHVGEVFEDGWTLSGLTNTAATLTRGGDSRTVGLNPTGAVSSAAPPGAPTTVRLAGLDLPPDVRAILDLTDDQVLDRFPPAIRGQVAGITTASPGLSLDETRRRAMLTLRYYLLGPSLTAAAQARVAAARSAGIDAHLAVSPVEILSALYPDYAQIEAADRAASYQTDLVRYDAARAAGLSTVRVATPPRQPGQASGAFVLPVELAPYQSVLMAAAVTDEARILVVTPPSDAPPSDAPRAPPVLTPGAVAGLRDEDGAALSAEAQAAILAANSAQVAANAAARAQASSGIGYGPFGPVTR